MNINKGSYSVYFIKYEIIERFKVNLNWFELTFKLDWFWLLHCYGFASIYFALSCITLFAVLRLRASLTSHPHFSSLNIFLLIFSSSRAICLYCDPYGSKNLFPQLFGRIIWDIAFPCIFSALALLHLGFVHELNEVKFGPSIVTNESCIFIAITLHFCIVIASDVLLTIQNSFIIVWIFTQIFFVIWGIFICLTFLFRCFRLFSTMVKLKSIDSTKKSQNDNLQIDESIVQMKPLVKNENKSEPKLSNETANEISSKPKIKITDENELTISFASDNTPSQHNLTDSGQESSVAVSPKKGHSSSLYRQSPKHNIRSKKQIKFNSNKNSRRNSAQLHSPVMIENEITSTIEESELKFEIQEKGLRSVLQQEMNVYSQTQKHSKCNLFESLLKRIIVLMVYGLIASIFQIIVVIGPHGLFEKQCPEIIFWFSFQTAFRSIELLIVFTAVSITTKSFHNYNDRQNFKQRSTPYC